MESLCNFRELPLDFYLLTIIFLTTKTSVGAYGLLLAILLASVCKACICVYRHLYHPVPAGRLPIKQVAGRKGDKDREERLHARANQEHLTRQLELELFLSL